MHTLNGASARHKFSHPLDQVAGNIYIIYIFLYKKEKKKKKKLGNILASRTTCPD